MNSIRSFVRKCGIAMIVGGATILSVGAILLVVGVLGMLVGWQPVYRAPFVEPGLLAMITGLPLILIGVGTEQFLAEFFPPTPARFPWEGKTHREPYPWEQEAARKKAGERFD